MDPWHRRSIIPPFALLGAPSIAVEERIAASKPIFTDSTISMRVGSWPVKMNRAGPSNVVAAKLLRPASESPARAENHELLKRRIKIALPPDKQIEPLHDERGEFELKLACACLYLEANIGFSGRDGHGEIHFGPLDGIGAVEIAFFQALPSQQLGENQFAASLWLARLQKQSARS